MQLDLITIAALLSLLGQTDGANTKTSSLTTTSTASSASTTSWSTATLFFVMTLPSPLAASVVSVSPNGTAYAIGCFADISASSTSSQCQLESSFTVTEGPSTAIYTETFAVGGEPTKTPGPATVNCDLYGSPTASQAVCTGQSAISGLGIVGSTSTLSGSQITYQPVTITAGAEKIAAASSSAATERSSTSSGLASAATVANTWKIVGVAAAAAVVRIL